MLVVFGIVFGSLLAAAGAEMFWITPGERALGDAVLAQIDGMQRLDPEGAQFEAESKKADAMVTAAGRVAFTVRDGNVATALSAYLMLVKFEREDAQVRRKFAEIEKAHPGRLRRDPASDEEIEAMGREARREVSARLHEVLDYNGFEF
jgi:hypothetical protein